MNDYSPAAEDGPISTLSPCCRQRLRGVSYPILLFGIMAAFAGRGSRPMSRVATLLKQAFFLLKPGALIRCGGPMRGPVA